MNASRIAGQGLHSALFLGLGMAGRFVVAVALGKNVSSEDYGVYTMVTAALGVTLNILPLGAHYYLQREVPGRPTAEAATIFKTVAAVPVLTTAALGLLVLLVPGAVALVSGYVGGRGSETIALIVALLCVEGLVVNVVRYLYSRGEIEAGNVVAFLEGGLWGVVALLGSVIVPGRLGLVSLLTIWLACACMAVTYGMARAGWKSIQRAPLRPRLYATAVRFGYPVMAASLVAVVTSVGRMLIASFHSLDVVGVFSFHHNLVLMVAGVASPIISGPIEPYAIQAYNDGNHPRSGRLLSVGFRYTLMLLVPLLVACATWERELVGLIAQREYAVNEGFLALLAPAPLCMAVAVLYDRVLFLERRSGAIARCYVMTAALQLMLFLALVPLSARYGPVVATDAGAAALMILLWAAARGARVPLDLKLARLAVTALVAIGAAVVLAGVLGPLPPIVALFVGSAGVLTASLIASRVCGVVSSDEERVLRGYLARLLPGLSR